MHGDCDAVSRCRQFLAGSCPAGCVRPGCVRRTTIDSTRVAHRSWEMAHAHPSKLQLAGYGTDASRETRGSTPPRIASRQAWKPAAVPGMPSTASRNWCCSPHTQVCSHLRLNTATSPAVIAFSTSSCRQGQQEHRACTQQVEYELHDEQVRNTEHRPTSHACPGLWVALTFTTPPTPFTSSRSRLDSCSRDTPPRASRSSVSSPLMK